MTVVPQQYTLHCVSIGGGYTITLYGNDQQIYSCENEGCVREQLHSSNSIYDNTVTITWDTQTISSGSFSRSVNGDQMYRCSVSSGTDRNRNLTIKGIKLFLLLSSIYILSSRIHSFSSY